MKHVVQGYRSGNSRWFSNLMEQIHTTLLRSDKQGRDYNIQIYYAGYGEKTTMKIDNKIARAENRGEMIQ